MKAKNIPNLISAIRLLLILVFLFFMFVADNTLMALVTFLIAGASDMLDGYLARRNNWVTNLGKILDPLADKLMQFAVLISFNIREIVPLWFIIPFFIKEGFTLLVGLIVIKQRKVVVVSKWYGKFAVCLFYATIAVAVIFSKKLAVHPILTVIIFIPSVLSAIVALIAYIRHYAGLKNVKNIKRIEQNL